MRSQPPSPPPPTTQPPSRTDSLRGLSGAELDAQLRKRVEKRIEDRNSFIIHLIVFLALNPMFWYIYFSDPDRDVLWPMFITLPWGVGLVAHAMSVYQNTHYALIRREQKVRREMEIEKQRLGITDDAYEKPKRHEHLRLSDDGELIPADEYEEQDVEIVKSKHAAR
jgi:hypothetical protein